MKTESFQILNGLLPEVLEKHPEVQNLVLSSTSGMKNVINAFKQQKTVKYDDDNSNLYPENVRVRIFLKENKPVAWGWVFPYQQRLNGKYRRRLAFMVFVELKFRRNGIGLSLFQWANDISKLNRRPLVVFPWEHISCSFYEEKCKVPAHYQNEWISF